MLLHPPLHTSVVDVEQGQILCTACGDYVYDSEIRRIAVSCKEKARRSLGLSTEYRAWAPDSVEMTLLQAHPKRRRPTPNSTIGLLYCFMYWFFFLLPIKELFYGSRNICFLSDFLMVSWTYTVLNGKIALPVSLRPVCFLILRVLIYLSSTVILLCF